MITVEAVQTSIVFLPRSPSGFELDWNELVASLPICGDRSSLAFEHSMMFTPFDLPLPRSVSPTICIAGYSRRYRHWPGHSVISGFNRIHAFLLLPMEVILMEYTIAGFMPVILASVTGTLVVQIFLGSASMFSVPSVGLSQWQEIPFVVVAGLLLGCLAAALVHGVRFVHRYAPKSMVVKITLAGATTAIIGLWIPEILGVGYDTVNFALAGQLGLLALTLIVFAKLVATLVAVAFGADRCYRPNPIHWRHRWVILWQLSQSVGLSDTDPAFFALLVWAR